MNKPSAKIKAELDVLIAARAWALADRTADDRAADVERCESAIVAACPDAKDVAYCVKCGDDYSIPSGANHGTCPRCGFDTGVPITGRPVPQSLLNDREAAVRTFRAACVAEGTAEEVFHDTARRLLDLEDQHG